MVDLLHPVGDGAGVGDIQVASFNGMERYPVLTPLQPDDFHVSMAAEQGSVIDQRVQRRGPIAFGDAVIRGRFARVAGDGGIEISIGLWGSDPRKAMDASDLIAQTRNFQIWQSEWNEYALQLIGREADRVAERMGDLWIRCAVISAIGGVGSQRVGVSALWLEVPTASEVAFQDPTSSPPPPDTLVTVRTFSGRSGTAKNIGGEWFDESDQPFEIDSHSLPLDANGKLQKPRGVNGWGA